ncbi:hypothetical protein ACJJIG_17970 [Microbulbifer sp. SSSA007]|uniref:hypothetical protein n=1 Tax=Microbulbifer sp. SSSA007 TaxID=3243379 RepID=UPI004039CE36
MANIPINIRNGFFEHWCDDFLCHYGIESEFPKALSDLYTIKVAKMMEKKGDFDPDTKLGLFSCEKAVESLRELITECEGVGKVLYKEGFGTAVVGSVRAYIDQKCGNGVFDLWLNHFERKEYSKCLEVIRKLH